MPSNMKRRNSLDQCHASAHSPLCVILMRSRVPKVREHPIAHILRDKSTGLGDLLCAAAVIRADDLAHVLGVEARRECGRTHKVAEHDRELSAFSRPCKLRSLRGGSTRGCTACRINANCGQFVTAFQAVFGTAGFTLPHDGQRPKRTAPHSRQNLLPSGLSALQLGHRTDHPLICVPYFSTASKL